jgi:hypothetical protein
MLLCNKAISPFQRNSMRKVGAMLAACVSISASFPALLNNSSISPTAKSVMGILTVLPIIGVLLVVARYLSGETDEFLRNLVVQSILWGFGLVMVTDTVLGSIVEYWPLHLPFGLLNMDLFIVTAMIAMRIQLWRNR